MNTPKPTKTPDPGFLPEISVTRLPSMFRAYPEGTEIKYRPYMYGEIKKFSQSKMNDVQRFNFIGSGVFGSIPLKDITMPDLLHLGLLRKLSTLGSDAFTTEVVCQNKDCKKPGVHKFKSTDLDFVDLKVDNLPIEIDFGDGEKYRIMPMTFGMYSESVAAGMSEDPMDLMARMCVNQPYEKSIESTSSRACDSSPVAL